MKSHRIAYCQVCHDIIPANSYFNHKTKCHVKPKFKCDLCPYETLRKDNLQRHKDTLHGENAVKCNICSKSFAQKKQCRMHLSKQHQ